MIAVYFPFVQALSTIAGALVLFAASQIRSGAVTAGSLIAYLLWVDQLFLPVQQVSAAFDGYQQASVGLQPLADLPAEASLRSCRHLGSMMTRNYVKAACNARL